LNFIADFAGGENIKIKKETQGQRGKSILPGLARTSKRRQDDPGARNRTWTGG